MGDSFQNLQHANDFMEEKAGKIGAKSSVYKTEAWGNADQNDFLNQVILLETSLSATELLDQLLHIEQTMGRKRIQKWEPRIIDLDILYFDDLVFKNENLTIPHPCLQKRRFALEPLYEIAAHFIHPVLNQCTADLLKNCTDPLLVEKL